MPIFDKTQLVFTQEDIKFFADLNFEDAFFNPELESLHAIETGIRAKKQIGIMGRLDNIGKGKVDCDFVSGAEIAPSSEKLWDPQDVDVPFGQCVDDLLPSFWAWSAKNGKDKQDLTGTDWSNWFNDLYAEAIRDAVLRIAWFSDTTASNVGDSPPGLITDGVSVDYYNIIDGLWVQLFAIGAADNDRQFLITENDGATFALQELAADKGQTILKELREGADDRLFDDPDGVIMVTKSIMFNYAETLRSKGVDASYERIEGGFNTLMYDGIPVIWIPQWDRKIKNDFNNTVSLYKPHRAVYTTKDNIPIGLEEEGTYKEFDEWYSKDHGEWRARGLFTFDAKVIVDSKIQVAH